MAFQCNHCQDWLTGSPDQEKMEDVCDECYKDHFIHHYECTCTEHDMCSFCQIPDSNLTEEERIDLENEVRKNLNRE